LSKEFLNPLKYSVIQDLPEFTGITNEQQYRNKLENFKYEVARETGIPLDDGYNGNLKAREAGVIGGHIGGKIGGHMVREMIRAYEASLVKA